MLDNMINKEFKSDNKDKMDKSVWDNLSIRQSTKKRIVKYRESLTIRPLLTDLVSFIVDKFLDDLGFPKAVEEKLDREESKEAGGK